MKTMLIIFTFILMLLFVGVINYSYEFYEPEICLKPYPTIQIFINHPDLQDNYTIESLTRNKRNALKLYENCLSLHQSMGGFDKIVAFVIIELFFTALFYRKKFKYKFHFFMLDILLFILALISIFITIELGLFYHHFMAVIIIVVLCLGLNYLIISKLRYYFFSKF